MNIAYYSTNGKSYRVDFRRAVMQGLAPDGGLFMPERIPQPAPSLFKGGSTISFQEVAFECTRAWLQGELPESEMAEVVEGAFNFPVVLKRLNERVSALELFHGPTFAFKDFGARFLARVARRFTDDEITVLVSTSGDTGSAIASAFFELPGTRVVLLYPQGGVSLIQEKQLTTFGGNVRALEVEGTFDDCQKLVKQAFVDKDLVSHGVLLSANSINIGRLIPQTFYYAACGAWLGESASVMSVPSGNFGNLTAGLFAKRMGLGVKQFIAATNANDVVPSYLESGHYQARPSVKTISNAMDVGNPSNFARMLELYGHRVETMRDEIHGERVSEDETKQEIERVFEKVNYALDPHGAVASAALARYLEHHRGAGVFLETAHPAKFADIVEPIIGRIEAPRALRECLKKEKQATVLPNDFQALKSFLSA